MRGSGAFPTRSPARRHHASPNGPCADDAPRRGPQRHGHSNSCPRSVIWVSGERVLTADTVRHERTIGASTGICPRSARSTRSERHDDSPGHGNDCGQVLVGDPGPRHHPGVVGHRDVRLAEGDPAGVRRAVRGLPVRRRHHGDLSGVLTAQGRRAVGLVLRPGCAGHRLRHRRAGLAATPSAR